MLCLPILVRCVTNSISNQRLLSVLFPAAELAPNPLGPGTCMFYYPLRPPYALSDDADSFGLTICSIRLQRPRPKTSPKLAQRPRRGRSPLSGPANLAERRKSAAMESSPVLHASGIVRMLNAPTSAGRLSVQAVAQANLAVAVVRF